MDAMKVLRAVAAIAAAIVVVPWLIRIVLGLAKDVSRYDAMRAMSDEKPMLEELGAMSREIVAGEKQALRDAKLSLDSLPADAMRYMKIRAM
jgi:hypothetical protein